MTRSYIHYNYFHKLFSVGRLIFSHHTTSFDVTQTFKGVLNLPKKDFGIMQSSEPSNSKLMYTTAQHPHKGDYKCEPLEIMCICNHKDYRKDQIRTNFLPILEIGCIHSKDVSLLLLGLKCAFDFALSIYACPFKID